MKRHTYRHPKLYALMTELKITRIEAIGLLSLLWDFTGEFTPTGEVGRYPNDEIARRVDWPTDRADALIDALIKTRWIDAKSDRAGRLVIHDWMDHCEEWVKLRLKRSAERRDNTATPSRRRRDTVATPSPYRGTALPCLATPSPAQQQQPADAPPDPAAAAVDRCAKALEDHGINPPASSRFLAHPRLLDIDLPARLDKLAARNTPAGVIVQTIDAALAKAKPRPPAGASPADQRRRDEAQRIEAIAQQRQQVQDYLDALDPDERQRVIAAAIDAVRQQSGGRITPKPDHPAVFAELAKLLNPQESASCK